MSSFAYSGGGGYAPYGTAAYTPYDSPVPNQPAWMQAQALAKKAYDQAKARLESQRTSVLNAAGYTSGRGGKGLMVDPKNAVGGIQMMLRGQGQEDAQMSNQFADRGIQGGLQHAGVTQLHLQHGSESAQFANQLQQTLGGIQSNIQDAGNQWASAQWQAQQEAAASAIANNEFNNPILPPEQARQPFGTPAQQPFGAQGDQGHINMLNNPAFMEFIKKLFAGGGAHGGANPNLPTFGHSIT